MTKSIFLMFYSMVFLCFGGQFCVASTTDLETGTSKLLSTVDGVVLFYGWDDGNDINYDSTKLNEAQKDDYKNKGLTVIAERFEEANSHETASMFAEVLARYYFVKKDNKKSMFWSFKAAENGSSFCMQILANAYASGSGVVQDLEESIKWRYLGAAAGDENCKQWVKMNGTNGLLYETTAPIIKEAQKRAINWMESHRDLFFTPN